MGLGEKPWADGSNPRGEQELPVFYLLLFLRFFNLLSSPRRELGFNASPKRDFVMSNAAWQKKGINPGRISMNFVKGSKYFRSNRSHLPSLPSITQQLLCQKIVIVHGKRMKPKRPLLAALPTRLAMPCEVFFKKMKYAALQAELISLKY